MKNLVRFFAFFILNMTFFNQLNSNTNLEKLINKACELRKQHEEEIDNQLKEYCLTQYESLFEKMSLGHFDEWEYQIKLDKLLSKLPEEVLQNLEIKRKQLENLLEKIQVLKKY